MIPEQRASPHVACDRVTKLFGSTVALWRVDLDVSAGQFVLVHGPNGSGKSTLLRILAGLTPPTAGHVRWDAPEESRPRVVRVGHSSGLYEALTPMEHFDLFARLGWTNADRAVEIFAGLGANHVLGRPCGGLSAGTRRRVALARAFASRADVVLLDEPLASLDERGATGVVDLIKETTDRGMLVIAAGPTEPRLRAIAHHLVALNQGRVLRSVATAVPASSTDAV
jgi:heme ABC exporter ATP-binding subunit CcmA